MDQKTLAIIGVPMDLGANNLGVGYGPAMLRQAGLLDKLSSTGLTVEDLGDVVPQDRGALEAGDPKLRFLDEIVRVSTALAAKTEQAIKQDRYPVILGGDHSVCLGAFCGAAAAYGSDLGMIYIDAHGDLNTAQTSPTGNIHGMHLASLLGFGAPQLANVYQPGAKLRAANLLHIGGSDLDKGEVDLINQLDIPVFTLFDLLTDGLAPLLQKIDKLAGRKIWVSLDYDSVDQLYAPAAGMPNAKGLSYREISAIATYVGERCQVVGMDIVEYSPSQDIEHKTAELGIELISNFFGKKYSWYSNYLKRNQSPA